MLKFTTSILRLFAVISLFWMLTSLFYSIEVFRAESAIDGTNIPIGEWFWLAIPFLLDFLLTLSLWYFAPFLAGKFIDIDQTAPVLELDQDTVLYLGLMLISVTVLLLTVSSASRDIISLLGSIFDAASRAVKDHNGFDVVFYVQHGLLNMVSSIVRIVLATILFFWARNKLRAAR